MEIAVLLLILLLAGKNAPRLLDGIKPLEKMLESGNIRELTDSKWFKSQTFGGVNGNDLAQTAKTLQNIARSGETLRGIMQGGTPELSSLAEILGSDSALGSLLQNMGGLMGANALGAKELFGENTHTGSAFSDVALSNPLAPVANIADEEIVYALTRCFANDA